MKRTMPELVKVEVANLEGELIVVHNKPTDGSPLEAASELHKLTAVLSEKAVEIKGRADQAFIGEVASEVASIPGADPYALDQAGLNSVVKEAVDELLANIAEAAGAQLEASSNAVRHADALDKVAQVLENHSERLKDQKIVLAAKELNNLDGFDR